MMYVNMGVRTNLSSTGVTGNGSEGIAISLQYVLLRKNHLVLDVPETTSAKIEEQIIFGWGPRLQALHM